MRFGILGPTQVLRADGAEIAIGGPRVRALLVMLLLDAGRMVPAARLIDGLYGTFPPRSAPNALQSQVSRLRQVLPVPLRSGGYVLEVDPSEVDAHVFTRLAASGRLALAGGDLAGAADVLGQALDLWRGPALADVANAPFAAAPAARLAELRLAAVEDRADAELGLGGHASLVPILRELVTAHPLRERPRALLMRALAASGRLGEALAEYDSARRTLAEELGADPSPALVAAHLAVLRGEQPAQAVQPDGQPAVPLSGQQAGPLDGPLDGQQAGQPAGQQAGQPTGPLDGQQAGQPAGPLDGQPAGPLDGQPTGPLDGQPTGPLDGQPTTAQDGSSAAVWRAALPAQLTTFVGREDDLSRVGKLLGERRLVTFVGPGGAGKTRLAIEAAARQAGDTAFVELAGLGDGSDIPRAVLGALGLRDAGLRGPAAPGGATDRLVAALTDRRLLLVLDNCEHVLTATARLTDRLLSACPELRIMTTSREPLGLTGEALFPVGGLALPPVATSDRATTPEGPATPEGAAAREGATKREVAATREGAAAREVAAARESAAVRLFADRAADVVPDFAVTAANAGAVLRICRALDGQPLAIELAAARLRGLPIEEIAARLDDRFRLLSRAGPAAPPRHRTLRAVVQWSWDLLDDAERILARRLTVFAGGATLAAVERVCGGAVVDTLACLVDRSLVELADGRYRMLDTIRAFCAERLVEAGEADVLRGAHAAYFLDLARTADPYLRRVEQLDWLRILDAERDNLHVALRRSTAAGDAETGLRLVSTLSFYWWLRGMRSEGAALGGEVLDTLGPEVPPDLAEEYAVAVFTASLSEAPVPAGYLPAAHSIVNALDRPPRQPFVLFLSGMTGGPPADDPEEVAALMEQRHAVLGADPWSHAMSALGLGLTWLMFEHSARAETDLAAALDGFRAIGDRWGVMLTLASRAEFELPASETAPGLAEALRLAEELGSTVDMADLLRMRGDVRLRTGDLTGAGADYSTAVDLARRAGAPEVLAAARFGLGEVARLRGDLPGARALYETALAECPEGWFVAAETRAEIVRALSANGA